MDHQAKIKGKSRRAVPAPPVRPGMRAEHAAEAILRLSTAEFAQQLARLMEPDAPGAVHQSRVVLRRLRATLQAFAPLIDPEVRRRLTEDLRDLFQTIGKVRDAEVLASHPVGEKQRRHLNALVAKGRHDLGKTLKSQHVDRLPVAMDAAFTRKSWRNRQPSARALRKGPVEALARLALDRAWARAVEVAPDLCACSARVRHELRKRLKGFRYMAEDFAPLWPPETSRTFLAELRALQEDLGHLNDLALAEAHGLPPDPAGAAAAMARAAPAWVGLQAASPWWRLPPLTGP